MRKLKAKRYALTLTAEQLTVVDRACDVYSRLFAGEFGVIVRDILEHNPRKEAETEAAYQARRDRLERCLRMAEPHMTNLEPNVHPSIHSAAISDSARVAYDVLKVIRYHQWQEDGRQPAYSVYGYAPTPASREPLPHIATVPEPQNAGTGISPSDCHHPRNMPLKGGWGCGTNTSYREGVSLCPDCGQFTVFKEQNGQVMQVTFELVSEDTVHAAGQYSRYLSEPEEAPALIREDS